MSPESPSDPNKVIGLKSSLKRTASPSEIGMNFLRVGPMDKVRSVTLHRVDMIEGGPSHKIVIDAFLTQNLALKKEAKRSSNVIVGVRWEIPCWQVRYIPIYTKNRRIYRSLYLVR